MNFSTQYSKFVNQDFNPSMFSKDTKEFYDPLAQGILGYKMSEKDVESDPEFREWLDIFWTSYNLDQKEAMVKAGEATSPKTSVSTPKVKTRSTKPKAERKPKAENDPERYVKEGKTAIREMLDQAKKEAPKTKTAAKPKAAKPKATAKPKPKAAAKPKAKKAAPAASAMTQRKMEKLKREVEQKAGTITNLKKLLSEEKQRLSVAKKLIDQEEAKVRKISAIADPALPTTSGRPRKNQPKAKATRKADQVRRVAERKGVRKSSLLSKRRVAKKK